MSPYTHLTLKDRECILLGVTLHHTYQVIADQIGCSKATVSREIKRNGGRGAYSAVKAQQNYQQRRLKSRRLRVLENLKLRDFVLHCILQRQWSPEQIAGRLSLENSNWHISYNTIYRGIERNNLGVKRKVMGLEDSLESYDIVGKLVRLKELSTNDVAVLIMSHQSMNDQSHVRIGLVLAIGKAIPFAARSGVRV